MGPLKGVRVLDFTRVLAGPFCSMNLADLGADVIKVEALDVGDETRTWGPPFAGTESAYYLAVNRNKRSIAINLKAPESRPVIEALICQADVVLHNFLPDSADRLGLGYNSVRAIRPDVVYCSISGFGRSQPTPGYDYVMQAMGGLMSITGEADGTPVKVGVAVVDLFTGLYACVAILSALAHRDKTGMGQAIDMALYDAQMAMLANVASNVLVSGEDAQRYGNEHPNIVPYQLFDTMDGKVVIGVGNDVQFKNFCKALGLQSLLVDRRFRTNETRVQYRHQLIPLLQQALGAWKSEELLEVLAEGRVPCGPVRTVKESLLLRKPCRVKCYGRWNIPRRVRCPLSGVP